MDDQEADHKHGDNVRERYSHAGRLGILTHQRFQLTGSFLPSVDHGTGMSLAAKTRAAVQREPFLVEALRAGVINYAAAARHLDVSDDVDAVATALRRFANDLPDRQTAPRDVTVTIKTGLERAPSGGLFRIGDHAIGADDGSLTGVLATGAVDPAALGHALAILETNGVNPEAAGVLGDSVIIVVNRPDGPTALQLVEAALADVPNSGL